MSTRIRDLTVRTVPVTSLKARAGNPRTHTQKQLRQIARSIKTFGWTNPILVASDGSIIAGHGRLEAARRLGIDEVPTISLEDMTEEQIRAYVIADNRLAELAGWDEQLLAIELQALSEIALDFNIEDTGFANAEIDLLISGLDNDESGDEADRLPPVDETASPLAVPGDLWLLGRHRLLCADATKAEAWTRLMDGDVARMVFTDPPYNVPITGHVCGLGSVQHAEFAMASGEMSREAFRAFLGSVLGQLARYSCDGAIHFVCMDWRHILDLLSVGEEHYSELKNICVWNKTNGGMGSLYRSKHELVAVFKSGSAPHVNNVELGVHGRYRTNVWDYAGINSFGAARQTDLAMHPTVKPVAMVEDAILDCSRRGDIVLDAFAGSGTTIIAAERAGRRCCAIELDPKYVDATLRRYRALTGEEPLHAASGLSLAEL